MKQDPFFMYITKNRESLSQQLFKAGTADKRYDRFPQILLPAPHFIEKTFSETVLKRHSLREYAKRSLTLQELSTFFYWSAGIIVEENTTISDHERRSYPSGGGKFPLELYVLILKEGEVERGVYHYSPERHTLEKLVITDIDAVLVEFAPHDDFAKQSGMIILFSFVKNRSLEKYGALAYKLAFMESGHISQNMYLVASALNLACCGLGISDGTVLNEKIQVSGINEPIFYAVAIGARK